MEFKIKSFESVGPLEFGMNTEQVQTVLGNEFHFVPNRSSYLKYQTEIYTKHHVFVSYDEDGKADGFEFTEDSNLYFNEIQLFATSMKRVINDLKAFDPNPREDNAGMDFLKLGISLYIPLNEKIEGVLVFKKGYFDNL